MCRLWIYIGTVAGEVLIFAHGTQKKVLAKIDMDQSILTTPVVANSVMYVMTRSHLYAIANGGKARGVK